MPKVSVIIPTHSRPHLLPRAVESAQKAGSDVEVIVVDDASTDETAEVCKRLKDIYYIRLNKNIGVGGARNVGILSSSTEYICFLDDDDRRLPGTLDLQLAALNAHPKAGLAYGQAVLADENYELSNRLFPEVCPSGDIFWRLLSWELGLTGPLIRKECFNQVGLLDSTIPGIDDIDIYIRLTEKFTAVALEIPVVIYRQAGLTSGQGSSNPEPLLSLAIKMLNERWLLLPRAQGSPRKMRREAKKRFLNRVSDILIWTGDQAIEHRQFHTARKNIITALQVNPLRAARPWTASLLARATFLRNS